MDISHNKYLKNQIHGDLVKYNIHKKYEFFRDYLIVDKETVENDPGDRMKSNSDYSYGLLTSIYNTDVFVLDMDRVPKRLYFDYSNNDTFINEFIKQYNKITNMSTIAETQEKVRAIVKVYRHMLSHVLKAQIKRIDLYESSTSDGLHLYIVLDKCYDLSGVYNYDLTSLVGCKGYLKFVMNSGHSNIRITNKVLSNVRSGATKITLLNTISYEQKETV